MVGAFSRENATWIENAKAREKDWMRLVALNLPLRHWSAGFLGQSYGHLNFRSTSLASLTLLNPKICNVICLMDMGEVHAQAC